jgi:integral membrane sensor domain MASE1
MLTEDESRFIQYWTINRDRQKKAFKQWLLGLPFGLLFGIPIIINLFSGWYRRAKIDLNSRISNSEFNPLVLIIAFLLITSFIAIFSKRHKWEMHEQKYQELMAKKEKENE